MVQNQLAAIEQEEKTRRDVFSDFAAMVRDAGHCAAGWCEVKIDFDKPRLSLSLERRHFWVHKRTLGDFVAEIECSFCAAPEPYTLVVECGDTKNIIRSFSICNFID